MVSKNQPRRIQFSLPDQSLNLHTRTEVMKPSHIFRDQVNTVAQWFDRWNDIEQTIACYSLLKRLGPTQARFLSLVLDYTFRDSAYEVQELEKEANDEEFLRGLCHESKEIAVQQLLLHLPLLHPGNEDARHEYLNLLPKILSHSLEYTIHEEECRQLLSLALVHPAFVPEERNSLTWWLGLLEDKGERVKEHRARPPPGFSTAAINLHAPLTGTKSACEYTYVKKNNHHASVTNTLSYKGSSRNNNNNNHNNHHHNINTKWRSQTQLTHTDSGIGNSFDNGPVALSHNNNNSNNKGNRDLFDEIIPRSNRSKPFLSEPDKFQQQPQQQPQQQQQQQLQQHSKVTPQSSVDSDEDNTLQKMNSINMCRNNNPGMQDVPIWLKSLRLHKYAYVFEDITYDHMLKLSEEYLTEKKVTKGARKKILLCIQKIKERHQSLLQLEKEVLQLGRLQHVLAELKLILMSPIKTHSNEEKGKQQMTVYNDEKPPIQQLQQQQQQQNEKKEGEEDGEAEDEEEEENKEEKEDEDEEEEDLPSDITRVMGKACTQILVTQPDEECCLTYLGLLDRVLSHEAFSPSQKKRLQSWKAQCQKMARQLATNRKIAGIEKGPKNWYDPLGNGLALTGKRRLTGRTSSLKQCNSVTGTGTGGGLFHSPLSRAGPLVAAQNLHKRVTFTNSHNKMNPSGHQSLSRTKSAPIRSDLLLQAPQHIGREDMEGINKSLETLCLSMTNHALEEKNEVGLEEAS